MIRKFNPMLFGMYCIEPSKRFVHRLLVIMISSVDVPTICVFFVDFGRKGKKAGPATEDPRDPKKAKLSSKSVKGVGGQAVKQANYRRRQVLEGYIETLRHVRGEAYTEAENSQALVVLHPLSAVRRGAQKPTEKESYCRSSYCTSWSWRAQPGRRGETLGGTPGGAFPRHRQPRAWFCQVGVQAAWLCTPVAQEANHALIKTWSHRAHPMAQAGAVP